MYTYEVGDDALRADPGDAEELATRVFGDPAEALAARGRGSMRADTPMVLMTNCTMSAGVTEHQHPRNHGKLV